MNLESEISAALIKLKFPPLTDDQVHCLQDEKRLDEALGMLQDLQNHCGLRLPMPQGQALGGPFETLEDARAAASKLADAHLVVALGEMATDESRATGVGNEFYITAFNGADASVALAKTDRWSAWWSRGVEQF